MQIKTFLELFFTYIEGRQKDRITIHWFICEMPAMSNLLGGTSIEASQVCLSRKVPRGPEPVQHRGGPAQAKPTSIVFRKTRRGQKLPKQVTANNNYIYTLKILRVRTL